MAACKVCWYSKRHSTTCSNQSDKLKLKNWAMIRKMAMNADEHARKAVDERCLWEGKFHAVVRENNAMRKCARKDRIRIDELSDQLDSATYRGFTPTTGELS